MELCILSPEFQKYILENMMKFKPNSILYDNGDFKIAWGLWSEDESEKLGMRWKGYPYERSGEEAWLVIPTEIEIDFIKALINKDGSNINKIFNVLKKIIP